MPLGPLGPWAHICYPALKTHRFFQSNVIEFRWFPGSAWFKEIARIPSNPLRFQGEWEHISSGPLTPPRDVFHAQGYGVQGRPDYRKSCVCHQMRCGSKWNRSAFRVGHWCPQEIFSLLGLGLIQGNRAYTVKCICFIKQSYCILMISGLGTSGTTRPLSFQILPSL